MRNGQFLSKFRISRLRLSRRSSAVVVLLGLAVVSCSNPPNQRNKLDLYAGWPQASQALGRSAADRQPKGPVRQVSHTPRQGPFAPLKVALPTIPDADFLYEDDFCMTCHETYVTLFKENNPHRTQRCEDCHGPATEHIASRGQEPGKILNFKNLKPAERSEICLKCHEDGKVPHVTQWRTSVHAHKGVSCSDCHQSHQEVPPGTPASTLDEEAARSPNTEIARTLPRVDPQLRKSSLANAPTQDASASDDSTQSASTITAAPVKPHMGAVQPDVCIRCHQGSFELNVLSGPHQVAPGSQFKCTTCHDAQGTLTRQTGKELCLSCHNQPLAGEWHSSSHNEAGLECIDCHNPHPNVAASSIEQKKLGAPIPLPVPMYVPEAQVCVRCHQDTAQLVEIADPHQVGGPNNFQCSTCHDPHGKIRQYTRQELCLKCHTGTPTAAWHSSVHNLQGVLCTDCHNPHPDTHVLDNVDIRHTNIRRPLRTPMSVNDPDTCYRCHPKQFAQSVMPSHHPIWEGKMVCSSCHNSHGEALRLLNEPVLNLVCYRCHMELQGPFVYEHPPVTQDCTICHNPHGAVANNLLHQPTTFLCLRCHSGHRNGPPFHDANLLPDIGTNPDLQRAFYNDCTECHSQIHGSDVPSPNNPHAFAR